MIRPNVLEGLWVFRNQSITKIESQIMGKGFVLVRIIDAVLYVAANVTLQDYKVGVRWMCIHGPCGCPETKKPQFLDWGIFVFRNCRFYWLRE